MELQKGYKGVQAEGAELIAISADSTSEVVSTRKSLEITYPMLSDQELQAISAYNVVDPGNSDIARPATFIVDENGKIAWKFIDEKFDIRLDSDRIIDELKKAQP